MVTARDNARRCVIAQAEAGSPGDHFLAARGFRKVLTLRFSRLPLAEVDTTALAEIIERPHPGYRLLSWQGTVPDDLAETFAASRHAMAGHHLVGPSTLSMHARLREALAGVPVLLERRLGWLS